MNNKLIKNRYHIYVLFYLGNEKCQYFQHKTTYNNNSNTFNNSNNTKTNIPELFLFLISPIYLATDYS